MGCYRHRTSMCCCCSLRSGVMILVIVKLMGSATIISAISGIIGFIGLVERKAKYIKIMWIVDYVTHWAGLIIAICTIIYYSGKEGASKLLLLIPLFITFCVTSYFISVERSYYEALKREKDEELLLTSDEES